MCHRSGVEAGSVVAHADADHPAVDQRAVDFDERRGLPVHRVERVADQVDHDLFEAVGVVWRHQRMRGKTGLDARIACR